MPSSASTPSRSKLPSTLARWAAGEAGAEPRTLILRLAFSVDLGRVREELEALGAQVESAGKGTLTAVMTSAQLAAVTDRDWLVAVQEPRLLSARLAPPLGRS